MFCNSFNNNNLVIPATNMKPKIAKIFAASWIFIVWSGISYLLWKPLIIPLLVLFAGYGSTYLRNNLIYGGYTRSIISGVIWGIFLSFGLDYLVNLTNSPFWWALINYFFGFLAACYIGYRGIEETKMLEGTRIESFYVIAQFSSIIFYVLSLLLLMIYPYAV